MTASIKLRLWIGFAGVVGVLVIANASGCKTLPPIPDIDWPDGPAVTNIPGLPGVGTNTGAGNPPPASSDDLDLSTVRWHGPDIRAWPVTAELKAEVRGGKIYMITELLKGRAATGDNGTTGNPWVIVKGSDDQWHAYTYEWITYDRKHRDLWKAFDRGHGAPSVCTNSGVRGAEFFVAVATVSRGNYKQNGNERTAFRKVVHP